VAPSRSFAVLRTSTEGVSLAKRTPSALISLFWIIDAPGVSVSM
jgi:hypothetical protein